ncbi:hypothetical protein AMC99_01033 [Altererythrobacter epoxidivorans]|uniref:Uncharacterized protein n=1 Tax=Altererythrobacter epoxidivorans TaxID=361183 RepID=A0A0M4MG85_9SPHN|nr:hypothetical protein [Altererythrobacter epoxidivorans]ALE16330.1 hypothetical protein AMC99_01033 [Altererythrobacter epoxidivorans]
MSDKNGTSAQPSKQHACHHGIYLLFEAGTRPDRDGLQSFVAADPQHGISFDPASSSSELADGAKPREAAPAWLEMLSSGLTFELSGLTPGESIAMPTASQLFDIKDANGPMEWEAICMAPGAHLSGGERTLPVIRVMMELARDLVSHFGTLAAVAWMPAGAMIGRRYFESTVSAWLGGGPFPAPGLATFEAGGGGSLRSVGLAHFIGQEIVIDPLLASDRLAATRLGSRIVNQLVLTGKLSEREDIIAPDGSRLVMTPEARGAEVHIRPG